MTGLLQRSLKSALALRSTATFQPNTDLALLVHLESPAKSLAFIRIERLMR